MYIITDLTAEFKIEAISWFTKNSKYELLNKSALFEEILQAKNDGKGNYELASRSTKSGRPELLSLAWDSDFVMEYIEEVEA